MSKVWRTSLLAYQVRILITLHGNAILYDLVCISVRRTPQTSSLGKYRELDKYQPYTINFLPVMCCAKIFHSCTPLERYLTTVDADSAVLKTWIPPWFQRRLARVTCLVPQQKLRKGLGQIAKLRVCSKVLNVILEITEWVSKAMTPRTLRSKQLRKF